MTRYLVPIVETRTWRITIEADSPTTAMDEAEKLMHRFDTAGMELAKRSFEAIDAFLIEEASLDL